MLCHDTQWANQKAESFVYCWQRHMHVFSHICRSIGRHFRCSVDLLIVTAWLKVLFQGNLLFFYNPMRNKLYTTVCMAKPFSTIFSPRMSKDYCKIVKFLR